MSQADTWYVRLPDGRTFWAASTTIVRQHLNAGRITVDSLVRRSPQEEWVALEWTEEFADLTTRRSPNGAAQMATVAKTAPRNPTVVSSVGATSRLEALPRRTAGIREIIHELLAALDSALIRRKLLIACVAGGLGGLLLACARMGPPDAEEFPLPLWWGVTGLFAAVIAAVGGGLLTRMTSIELSRLRPARWPETISGLGRLVSRLLLAYLLIPGVALLAIAYLRW